MARKTQKKTDAPVPEVKPPVVEAELIGYVRMNRDRTAMKINICAQAFERARRYVSQDGQEYITLVVSSTKVRSVLDGEREVTSVVQLIEG